MKQILMALCLSAALVVPAPQAAVAQESEGGSDPLVEIFGDGGMDLKAERMDSKLNQDTGEISTMRIQGGVDIESEMMDLECDDLVIDMDAQLMTATGRLVRFKQEEVRGTCGRLVFNIETGETVLTGTPKPSIIQEDATGRVTQTSANKITMVEGDAGRNIEWDGDAEFKILPAKTISSGEDGERTEAKKVDSRNVKDLKAPVIGG